MVRQAAAVAEQVAQRDLARHPRVGQAKAGVVVDRAGRPSRPLPVADQAASTVEAIGFDTDASWKTVSASTALRPCPPRRTPKPLRWTTSSRADDGDRQAGHAGLLQRLAYEIVERRERRLDPLRRGSRGVSASAIRGTSNPSPVESSVARRVRYMGELRCSVQRYRETLWYLCKVILTVSCGIADGAVILPSPGGAGRSHMVVIPANKPGYAGLAPSPDPVTTGLNIMRSAAGYWVPGSRDPGEARSLRPE